MRKTPILERYEQNFQWIVVKKPISVKHRKKYTSNQNAWENNTSRLKVVKKNAFNKNMSNQNHVKKLTAFY